MWYTLSKMKIRDIHIRITDEKYKLIKTIAKGEYRKVTAVIDKAIDNYLRAKKLLPLVCLTKKDK